MVILLGIWSFRLYRFFARGSAVNKALMVQALSLVVPGCGFLDCMAEWLFTLWAKASLFI
jgi:hypothetical protein